MKSVLSEHYYFFFKSNVTEKWFRIKYEDAYWEDIRIGVLEDSVLRKVLYLLYTNDEPKLLHSIIYMFADEIVMLAIQASAIKAISKLQRKDHKVDT